jgi:hypothetical protein
MGKINRIWLGVMLLCVGSGVWGCIHAWINHAEYTVLLASPVHGYLLHRDAHGWSRIAVPEGVSTFIADSSFEYDACFDEYSTDARSCLLSKVAGKNIIRIDPRTALVTTIPLADRPSSDCVFDVQGYSFAQDGASWSVRRNGSHWRIPINGTDLRAMVPWAIIDKRYAVFEDRTSDGRGGRIVFYSVDTISGLARSIGRSEADVFANAHNPLTGDTYLLCDTQHCLEHWAWCKGAYTRVATWNLGRDAADLGYSTFIRPVGSSWVLLSTVTFKHAIHIPFVEGLPHCRYIAMNLRNGTIYTILQLPAREEGSVVAWFPK